MPPRKELCRNFQRGSCQYGDRCKFLHATPQGSQQSKPNPFGFGAQNATPFQQQQTSNPFGFGVQNNVQSRGANDFGPKPNQFKPFENKWSRFSPANNNSAPASNRPDNQPPAAKHTCTNAEVCKRMIVEENEKPLWKLTCYSHYGYGPCDIVGDISYEELRALAYDDAKQGQSLQFIVERERSLLNSKLMEFQNIVQKPYTIPSAPTPNSQNLFAGGSANALVVNNGPSSQASSFSQLSGLLNTGSAAAPNYAFGQASGFQNNSQPSSSGMLPINNLPFSSGAFGSQISKQSSFSFGVPTSSNGAVSAPGNPFSALTNSSQTGNIKPSDFGSPSISTSISDRGNPFSSLANSSQTWNTSDRPLDSVANGVQLISNMPKGNSSVDDSIWSAQWKWNAGEIPEDAPPEIHIH